MLTLQGAPPVTLNAAVALGAKAVKSLPCLGHAGCQFSGSIVAPVDAVWGALPWVVYR